MEKKTTKIIVASTFAIVTAVSTFCLLRNDKNDMVFPVSYGALTGVIGGIVGNDEVDNYYKKLRK